MKRLLMMGAAALTLLLTGCASTIRSDVTVFHQWPSEIADKTYVFEAVPEREPEPDSELKSESSHATLEMQSYQNLVRAELARLGFHDAGVGGKAALAVSMRLAVTAVPVRVLEPFDPFFFPAMHQRFLFAHPHQRSLWRSRLFWGGLYNPFYDPFWNSQPQFIETVRPFFKRELRVGIKSIDTARPLFDVTVHNISPDESSPALMPALVHSAFADFPGVSGVPRRVEFKRQN